MTKIVEAQTYRSYCCSRGDSSYSSSCPGGDEPLPIRPLEADSEIVAGYHTEYSGIKFALFYLGEYGIALAYAGIIATLFLGGWQGRAAPGALVPA